MISNWPIFKLKDAGRLLAAARASKETPKCREMENAVSPERTTYSAGQTGAGTGVGVILGTAVAGNGVAVGPGVSVGAGAVGGLVAVGGAVSLTMTVPLCKVTDSANPSGEASLT